MNEETHEFLRELLFNGPTFLTLIGGCAVALTWGHKYPIAAGRVVLGCIWLMVVYLASITFWRIFFPVFFVNGLTAGARYCTVFLSLLESVGFIILISAVFVGRKPASYYHFSEPFPDDDEPDKPEPPAAG